MDLEDKRKEYQKGTLSKKTLSKDPFQQVSLWIEEALASEEIEPTAACLATSTRDGKVSSRMVLLKGFSKDGAYFFTNLKSKKGAQLQENHYASLTLYWKLLERQVILEGPVTLLPKTVAAAYFAKRSRHSQLGTLASQQGAVIPNRKFLEEKYDQLEKKYEGKEIPLPPNWGGFALHPHLIELWQGRVSRLHDHFAYHYQEPEWILERISP
jgi:pyridoxamine 5'-phosphate oxidase